MNKKVIIAVALLAVIGIAAYLSQKHKEPEAPKNETANQRRTYVNEEFGYSIDYPCDKECQNNHLIASTKSNGFLLSETTIPTTDQNVNLSIAVFSKQSVKKWYDATKNDFGDAESMRLPFEYENLNKIIMSSVGTSVQLYDDQFKANSTGTIILVDGKKAIKDDYLFNIKSYPTRNLYISIDKDLWLVVSERYYGFYKSIRPKIDRGLWPQDKFNSAIKAAEETWKTLRINYPQNI